MYSLDGTLIRQLTSGEWPVSKVSGVDEKGGWVYFEGWTGTLLERHLYRVPLEGGDVEPITATQGWHQTVLSSDATFFIDTHSTLMQPPQVHLYTVGGERLTTLEANELPERAEYHWIEPQFVTLEAEDGTPLYGRLTLPLGFAPGRKYPTIVKVYGGPHAQTVADAWDASLYGQLFAQAGYVVWELDNRGMGGRGKAFCAALYEHMGGVEVADQLVGVEYLKTLPYVDPARIGVFGWSYGGYMTLMCMSRAPEAFRAGVAVAPVTDWKLYDTHYTEHYMGHPAENEAGYRESSVLTYIEGPRAAPGKLLLVHGMADDNVLFQNSVLLMEAFLAAREGPVRDDGLSGQKARHTR